MQYTYSLFQRNKSQVKVTFIKEMFMSFAKTDIYSNAITRLFKSKSKSKSKSKGMGIKSIDLLIKS